MHPYSLSIYVSLILAAGQLRVSTWRWKAMHPYSFYIYVSLVLAAGQYLTVRGCAPFTTETFPKALQRGMGGSYWKVGSSFFLVCKHTCSATLTSTLSQKIRKNNRMSVRTLKDIYIPLCFILILYLRILNLISSSYGAKRPHILYNIHI
jgi:hypothetical protein